MTGKRNNGFVTKVTVANKVFEIDGYIKKDIMENLLSWKAIQALDWTNNLGETESCFIENKLGETFELEFEDINAYECRKFDNCLSLSKAIEAFVQNI